MAREAVSGRAAGCGDWEGVPTGVCREDEAGAGAGRDAGCAGWIVSEMEQYLVDNDIADVRELIGALKVWVETLCIFSMGGANYPAFRFWIRFQW